MVSPVIRQTWAVTGVLLNMLGQGMVLSYPSCLLPALKHPDSLIQVDINTASWLASSVGISSMLGFIISSYLMEYWGRRMAQALVILPGTLGWALIYLAQDVPTLMVGRVLGGITAGASVTLGAVVIGEFTSPVYRGMFLNLKTAAVCLGNTIVHILSTFFHWRTVAICGLVPNILGFGIVCTWTESPAWLASKKKFDKSERSFFYLRGRNPVSKKEYEEMVEAQKLVSSNNDLSFRDKTKDFFHKFTRKDFIKPCLIIFLGAVVLEASGRHTFPAYASTIIQEISGSSTQSFYYTLCLDLIITASATFSSLLVKVMKRRTVLFSTGIAAIAVLFIVCSYQYLVFSSVISKDHTWIPLTMLVVYFILANLGCTPIPLAFLGEVFPLAHRAAGSTVSGLTLSLNLVASLKVTPYLLNSIYFHGTFAFFGVTMAVALLALYFVLPETKDRTLQEIEDYFNYGKFRDDREIKDDKEAKIKMMS